MTKLLVNWCSLGDIYFNITLILNKYPLYTCKSNSYNYIIYQYFLTFLLFLGHNCTNYVIEIGCLAGSKDVFVTVEQFGDNCLTGTLSCEINWGDGSLSHLDLKDVSSEKVDHNYAKVSLFKHCMLISMAL